MGTRKLFNLYLSLAATPTTSSAVILPLAAMETTKGVTFFQLIKCETTSEIYMYMYHICIYTYIHLSTYFEVIVRSASSWRKRSQRTKKSHWNQCFFSICQVTHKSWNCGYFAPKLTGFHFINPLGKVKRSGQDSQSGNFAAGRQGFNLCR